MNDRIKKEQSIFLCYNPSLQYEVLVTNDLLDILCVEKWTLSSEESIPKENFNIMVYFDLAYNDRLDFYRVAIFQNGYALVQINENGKFEKKQWYTCHSKEKFFDEITPYIQRNLIQEENPMNK